jgi:hypothetical protein
MRRLLRRYATWGLLRHARAKARQAPLTSGIRHGQTARLKTAVHFTSWLASRGLDLAACRQPDLDTYLLACPAQRDEVRHFLAWGRRYRDRALTVAQAPRPDTTVPLAQDQRWALARSLLHDNGHDPGDRVAGLLVLLFGQHPGRIASLTTSHISLDAGRTTLTLGITPISIPEPLGGHLHALANHRRHLSQIPAGGPGPWLFPGMHPGQPVLPATISHRRPASASTRHRPRQRAPATRRRAPAHRRRRPARPPHQDRHRLGPARRPPLGRLPGPARPAAAVRGSLSVDAAPSSAAMAS